MEQYEKTKKRPAVLENYNLFENKKNNQDK